MRCLSFLVVLLLAATLYSQDMPLTQILIDGQEWRTVGGEFQSIGGLAVAKNGDVFVSDPKTKKIFKFNGEGKTELFAATDSGAQGLVIGPDAMLYACEPEKKRISIVSGEKNVVVAEGIEARNLVVTQKKVIYCTDPGAGTIWSIVDKKPVKAAELKEPIGLTLWSDEGTLLVSEANGRFLWTFRIEADGRLTCKDGYATLRERGRTGLIDAGGLIVDDANRFYAATASGVQIFDPTGRMSGVLTRPSEARCIAVALGGVKGDTLYSVCGNRVFARTVKPHGVPWMEKPK